MDLIDRLDAARSRWNILDHPFYRRWECGELSRSELATYAAEYRHAVVALAQAAETAAPLAGLDHAAEERAHIELWDDFGASVGANLKHASLPETDRCVAAWTAGSGALEALAVLYAIEAGQPEVSRTKLAGLVDHYGFTAGSPDTAYFALHVERDRDHADHSRDLLARHARPVDSDRLVAVAEAALVGNWTLLDGVDR
jgi:pyrroloquinoline-quinone synthase